MHIKVNIKQLGKKRAAVAEADFTLGRCPSNVRELIGEAVHTCVLAYNERVARGEEAARPLSAQEIHEMSEIGKIAFGINYGGRQQDEGEALENALQAYEDGIFRVFIGESEAGLLDDPVTLHEGDSVTFIRLAMLSGRMW